MPPHRPSYRLIDLLKIVAAQCIVLHHFSAYGPLSDAAAEAAPELMEWLYDYARMAVQIFLVVAGYLAARSLAKSQHTGLWTTLSQRYMRLVIPFMAALGITVLCSALARPYLEGDVVPALPTLAQLLAHASLLHSVLEVDSLSAGVWYVAIDFQLYALLALLLWLGRGRRWFAVALVAGLAVSSLAWFNLDADLDVWAPYFFGAYGLGALAWWAGLRSRHGGYALGLYAATLLTGLGSLALEFRARIALAMGISTVLLSFGSVQLALPRRVDRWVQRLSNCSYALFLVHFSVLLLANALWEALGLENTVLALAAIAASWLLSIAAGHVFHLSLIHI